MANLKWDQNWIRSYKISLGTRERKKETYITKGTVGVLRETVIDQSSDDQTIPSDAIVLGNIVEEGFNIRGVTFNFDGTVAATEGSGSKSEVSTLTLYNLNKEAIRVINQPNAVVIIEAGYKGKVELAYTGDISYVDTRKSGADIAYDIKCTSSGETFRNTLVSLQYDESLDDRDIIIDMAKRFPGTALGSYGLEGQRGRFTRGGHNFYGKLHTEFDKLMQRHNLSWCVFNGKIVIIPYRLTSEDINKFNRKKFTLSANLIKRISEKTDRSGEFKGDTKERTMKLVMNTFFIPAEVGQFIEIPNEKGVERFNGTYLIKGKRLILSSKGNGAWDSVFDLEQVI